MENEALYILFDLDGVLVDNVAFERAITSHIIDEISRLRHIPIQDARLAWDLELTRNKSDPRWHDYGFHCSALGVPDVWRTSHQQMQYLLHAMPGAVESVETAKKIGNCWLASDATDWVVRLKLDAAGFDSSTFQEIFTLDRCHTTKGDATYWLTLKECMGQPNSQSIYVDNRLDRLIVAAEVLPNCQLVHVDADDHPLSLRLFPEVESPKNLRINRVSSIGLAKILRSLSN